MTKNLNDTELTFVRLVAKQYYEVIPEKYKTYCVFNARVLARVFRHYGLEAEVVTCQALLSGPFSSSIIGFVGSRPGEGGWDGHAICRVGNYFIDATLDHFSVMLGEKKIETALFEKFKIESNILGRFDITDNTRLWWINPPVDVDSSPPTENSAAVNEYSAKLIEHLEKIINPSKKQLLVNFLRVLLRPRLNQIPIFSRFTYT